MPQDPRHHTLRLTPANADLLQVVTRKHGCSVNATINIALRVGMLALEHPKATARLSARATASIAELKARRR